MTGTLLNTYDFSEDVEMRLVTFTNDQALTFTASFPLEMLPVSLEANPSIASNWSFSDFIDRRSVEGVR